MKNLIKDILKKHYSRDHWLGARETASLEAELINELNHSEPSFSDFKSILSFFHKNDMDDSATGLVPIYSALNNLLKNVADEKSWKWLKEHAMVDDRFLETVFSVYDGEKYRSEILSVLEFGTIECYLHSLDYYIALLHKEDPHYEKYLESSYWDVKKLKMEYLCSRGEKKAAFEFGKDDPELVLYASTLVEGKEKEEYLLRSVLTLKERYAGQRRSWWDVLCETAGDKYLDQILSSSFHCQMANDVLYQEGRYEQLMKRIEKGWVYDDLWGHIHEDPGARYDAVKRYKKLQKFDPERCAEIMVDYAVFMMNKLVKRSAYRMSAQTLVRAGKLSEESRKRVRKKVEELIKEYPNRTAMIEELHAAGLVD